MSAVQYKTVSPVGNRVFVKVDMSEPVSTGGILLPTSAQKKPTQGEVVSLGDAKSLKVPPKPYQLPQLRDPSSLAFFNARTPLLSWSCIILPS